MNMKKKKLSDAILEEAARMVVEEDFREQNKKAMKYPHTVSPEFQMKMNRIFARANAFTVHKQSETTNEDEPFLKQLDDKEKNNTSLWTYRRYIAVMALLMLGVSGAVLANDDIRNGLNRLRLQFFSDNVTIESSPESTTEQKGPNTANGEFHAYKWMEVPEGYHVVYEEENAEFGYYIMDFENDDGNFINYMQNDASLYTTSITYDEVDGYKRTINLYDEVEAYSISDGKNNTIFYEKDGYLFRFMSNQSENVIINYINISDVLNHKN